MAITLVGSADDGVGNGGNIAITLPGGTAENDVVYAGYIIGSTADRAMSISTAGYTELTEIYSDDTFDANVAAYRKVQGSTPDSTFTCVGSGQAADTTYAATYVLRGVDTTTPEDATTTTATGINTLVPDPAAITTVTANAWVLLFAGASKFDTSGTSAPSGYTNLISSGWGTDTNNCSLYAATREIASPGAQNPAAFAGMGADAQGAWGAVTIAARPASATPAVFAGSIPVALGQTGGLSGGASLAASAAVVFGQSGDFVAAAGPANFAGTIAIAFNQTGDFHAETEDEMAIVKWAAPGTVSANLASTTLDSLANGSTSTLISYDNSTNLDLYGSVLVNLGSFTSTTGASITLRVFAQQDTDTPDSTGSVGGGETYTQPITVGASAKVLIFPMIRLYPEELLFCLTNNGGAALAASANSIKIRTYNEEIA